jgi:single-strand DNA-binding protein
MALPSLTATGNLTDDPQIRFTSSGKAVASFTVACSKRRQTEAGGWEDSAVCFLRCTVWEREAEAVGEVLTKGAKVTVVGALKQSDYTDKEGNKRTSYDVDVYSVALVVKARTADREKPAEPSSQDPWATPADSSTPPF